MVVGLDTPPPLGSAAAAAGVPVVLAAPRGKTHARSALTQLEHTGRCSSQRMWRRLHSAQPLRDLRWERRVLLAAAAAAAAAASNGDVDSDDVVVVVVVAAAADEVDLGSAAAVPAESKCAISSFLLDAIVAAKEGA